MSQRARILWAIALVVLPLALLNGARVWQKFNDDRDAVQAERLRLAEIAALSLRVFMENNVAAVQALALHPELARGRATAELREFLQRVVQDKPDWVGVGVIGADGTSLMGTLGQAPVFVGDRSYFKAAVATGQALVSSGIIGRVTRKPTVVVAAPFALQAGGRGVLVAPLPIDVFANQLLSLVRPADTALAVLDSEGQVVVRTEGGRAAGLASLRDVPQVAAALRGDRGAVLAPLDGSETLLAYAPVSRFGWAVLALEPAASAFAAARRELAERLAALLVMLGAVAAIAWYLSGRLVHAYQREVQARTELERAVSTRNDFLAAASHDLRNPLAAVRSANDVLRLSLSRGPSVAAERIEKCVAHIDSATRRMISLIDAFLDVARLQSGAPLDLVLEDLDLARVLRDIAGEARLLSPRHGFSVDAPERLMIRADPDLLRRAVGNLVNNAVKYSPSGGEIGLRLECSDDGAWAIVSVSDTGIGIPPGELASVFERFRRGSNVIGRIAGTGIGLAGARQIIEQHGGTIEVESRLGEGTRFTLRLPCQGSGQAGLTAQREAA
jgi:signal transduction histidine kinase